MKSRLFLLCLMGLMGCASPTLFEGDDFWIQSGDALMPVLAKGNVDSGKMVIFVQGGPGNSAIFLSKSEAFMAIEEEALVVYYDQRACGASLGNPTDESLNLGQYVEDLEVVVDVVEDLYAPDEITLLGWSWGGLLSKAYLIDNQERIDGYVEVGGARHLSGDMELSSEWIVAQAQERLDDGGDQSLQELIDRHSPHQPVITVEDFVQQSNDVDVLGGYFVGERQGEVYPGLYTFGDLVASPLALLEELQNSERVVTVLVPKLMAMEPLDYSTITTPVHFVWGAEDGILPVSVAEAALSELGTADADKRLTVIEDGAHSVLLEQPEPFAAEVIGFINR